MEVKWDIYLHEGHLSFARSWTDELSYRAVFRIDGDRAIVGAIQAPGEIFGLDPAFCVAAVDYLIRSHLYHQTVVHPFSNAIETRDPQTLAVWSFSMFGRYAEFGSFADTTKLPALEAEGPE
jgi:hypothetical protein